MDENWDEDAPVTLPKQAPQYWTRPERSESDEVWSGSTSTTFYNRNQDYNRDRGHSNGRGDRGGYGGRGNGRQKNEGFTNWRSQGGGNDKSEVMKIPSRFVGRVIGRGGSKISELQTESGARINVTKETEGDDTIIKLFGEDEAMKKAMDLINELTIDPSLKFVSVKEQSEVEAPRRPAVIDWQNVFKQCDEAASAQWENYPEIKKEFYIPHPEVLKMTQEEVELFRQENNNIVVDRTFKTENSRPVPKPCPKFYHSFHQYPDILEEIRKAGFETPSPIQAQGWPVLLSGEDLIGIAQTGTGKTLAFLLPALIHIDGQPGKREERGGPAVLIMAPTRELALQIDKEIKKYQYRGITSVCVYGGGNRREQVRVVTEGVDIVIATPGRLNDLSEAGHLNVKTVTYVVLDEADRMLDMGFEPQIRKVMYQIRPTRQTIMTSATWPLGVRRLAQSYMVDPVQVYVGTLDLAATHTVTQVVHMLPDDDCKMEAFIDFIQNMGPDQKVIVFCGKKSRADELGTDLSLAGIDCQIIHGDRDQIDREQAIKDITDGTVQILVATDVASRGLDIDDITHVLNYDFPRNIEEYVHRVGRTGRAGKYGESISYFTRGDWAQAKDLINILEEAEQYIPEELCQMAERYKAWSDKKEREGGGRGGRGGRRDRW